MKTQETTELPRTEISTEILDFNTLLVVSKREDEEYPLVSVKYMDNDKPRETFIARLTPDTLLEYNDRMVAVSLPSGRVFKRRRVETIYDVKKHDFISREVLNLTYSALTYEGSKVKQLDKRSK